MRNEGLMNYFIQMGMSIIFLPIGFAIFIAAKEEIKLKDINKKVRVFLGFYVNKKLCYKLYLWIGGFMLFISICQIAFGIKGIIKILR